MQSVAGLNMHVLSVQVAVAWKKSQTRPQAPQLFSSFVRLNVSSIGPLQLLSSPSQASTPAVLWKHMYSQPLEAAYGPVISPSRSLNPGKQPVMPHAPAWHVVCAPGLLHWTPHAPQFISS